MNLVPTPAIGAQAMIVIGLITNVIDVERFGQQMALYPEAPE